VITTSEIKISVLIERKYMELVFSDPAWCFWIGKSSL